MDIRLLIADDEKMTREGLISYIDWSALGVTSVRSAPNGEKALKIAQEFHPDILLTDVKMPHMDGIELARHIRSQYPDCRILFLSAYADKQYLKSAIDLKAETYIEKPIVLNQVALTISRVVEDVKAEAMKRQLSDFRDTAMQETKEIIHIDIVQELISPSPDWEQFRRKYVPAYFSWQDNTLYTVACIRIFAQMDFLAGKQLCHRLSRFLLEARLLEKNEFYLGFLAADCPVFVTSVTPSAVLHGMMMRIQDYLKQTLHYNSSIVIGPYVHRIADIRHSYVVASENLEYHHMYYKTESVLECHSAPETHPSPAELFSRRTSSQNALEQLFTRLEKERYTDIANIKCKLYELYVFTCYGDPIPWETFRLCTLRDCRQLICYGAPSAGSADDLAEYPKALQKAIRYMFLNYMDPDLNIGSIAAEVGLSANYFCTVFRQNTGITVNDYLTDIRLDKTAFYLKCTEIKFYEIAERVGIPDASYLNTLFKKRFGKTLRQYRRDEGAKT